MDKSPDAPNLISLFSIESEFNQFLLSSTSINNTDFLIELSSNEIELAPVETYNFKAIMYLSHMLKHVY